MAIVDGRTWLEYLNASTCWKLLTSTPVGRVAVINDSAPEIYPVNFVVDDKTIVFRTDSGNKLRGLSRIPLVCFEIDGIDVDESTGWSVLVKGRAQEIDHPDDRRRVAQLPLHYWTFGHKTHWIRIVPTEVSGRRIRKYPSAGAPRNAPT